MTSSSLARWTENERYQDSYLISASQSLENAIENARKNGLPDIAVNAAMGKFLKLQAISIQARRILEIGTLGGYSTIWMAQALPAGGKLVTIEVDQKHADVAMDNIDKAGLSNKVEVIVGPGVDVLAKLSSTGTLPFDLIFIDADKKSYPAYFQEAKRLVRQGGIIICDNVVRDGRTADLAITDDENVNGVRQMLSELQHDKDVDATTINTVGSKGYDGFLFAIRL